MMKIEEKIKQIEKYKEQKSLIELELNQLEEEVAKEKFDNKQVQETYVISNRINQIIKKTAKRIKQSPSGAIEFFVMNYKGEEGNNENLFDWRTI